MDRKKLDYREAVRLLEGLKKLNDAFSDMMSQAWTDKDAVRREATRVLLKKAYGDMQGISVEELRKSKAGIRVDLLKAAGYTNLSELGNATDHELTAIEGIGEKQVEAIRRLLAEFADGMTARMGVSLRDARTDATFKPLLHAIMIMRRGELLREETRGLAAGLQAFTEDMEERVIIRNRLRWIFSSRTAKETTASAAEDMLSFFGGELCAAISDRLGRYQALRRASEEETLKDYEENAAAYYSILEEAGVLRVAPRLSTGSLPEALAEEVSSEPLSLANFRGRLRSYQAFGVRYILHQRRVLLGDEMGLGKTVQAIAAMAHIAEQEGGGFFLVICPASVLINWCREVKTFSTLPVYLLHGPSLENTLEEWASAGGVAVTNYEMMERIVGRIDRKMRLSMLVIDEAHFIKNPDAKRTRYIRRLDEESDRILLMTGTPLENKAEEMCTLIGYLRKDLADKMREMIHVSAVPAFRELASPVYLRRRRDEVLTELPPLEEMKEWLGLTPSDREAYAKALSEGNFQKVRRVSFLDGDGQHSAKAARLLELVSEAKDEGRKIVVFSFFRETVARVREILGRACIGAITGSTAIAEWQRILDDFSDAPGGCVLVCQTVSGGTGLNIQAASVVIFCEPQIKPSLTRQALSRVYRMGQVRNVLVYHLLCEDTVDEVIWERLKEKQAAFDLYAEESAMAESEDHLFDRRWIAEFLEKETGRYLPSAAVKRRQE